jgi:lysophospholipase L1-like esterase
MKKILCYGDSNTFGFNPSDGSRFDNKTRWTALLQEILGTEYEVINEGMCDRTGFTNNPKGFDFSAQRHFPKMITKLKDIDLLILAIGTNDLQFKYDLTIHQFENGLEKLIVMAKDNVRRIILIPPVILSDNVLEGNFNFQFNSTSIVKSKKVGKIYRKLSNLYGLDYFDLNNFVKPSNVDGLHYDSEGHNIISTKLSDYIKSIYA